MLYFYWITSKCQSMSNCAVVILNFSHCQSFNSICLCLQDKATAVCEPQSLFRVTSLQLGWILRGNQKLHSVQWALHCFIWKQLRWEGGRWFWASSGPICWRRLICLPVGFPEMIVGSKPEEEKWERFTTKCEGSKDRRRKEMVNNRIMVRGKVNNRYPVNQFCIQKTQSNKFEVSLSKPGTPTTANLWSFVFFLNASFCWWRTLRCKLNLKVKEADEKLMASASSTLPSHPLRQQ